MVDLSGGSIGFYLVLGLAAGVLSASLGIGSGIIVVPALTLLAAFTQKQAQGIALTIMIPMAIMGALRYYLNPDIVINYWVVLILSAAVVIGANIGASLAAYLSNRTLQYGFSILLFIMGIRMFLSAYKSAP
ncbi:MAG: sulfite exporter TauE/SafE family protein [Candidatus Omnitrophota bacterium]